jgi:hypothetical protein
MTRGSSPRCRCMALTAILTFNPSDFRRYAGIEVVEPTAVVQERLVNTHILHSAGPMKAALSRACVIRDLCTNPWANLRESSPHRRVSC